MIFLFGIVIIACSYIIRLRKVSIPLTKKDAGMNQKLNELFVLIMIMVIAGILLCISVIVYQLSIIFLFWSPQLSITYISSIYTTYILHLIISMYIVNHKWKKVIRKILCIKEIISPNGQMAIYPQNLSTLKLAKIGSKINIINQREK